MCAPAAVRWSSSCRADVVLGRVFLKCCRKESDFKSETAGLLVLIIESTSHPHTTPLLGYAKFKDMLHTFALSVSSGWVPPVVPGPIGFWNPPRAAAVWSTRSCYHHSYCYCYVVITTSKFAPRSIFTRTEILRAKGSQLNYSSPSSIDTDGWQYCLTELTQSSTVELPESMSFYWTVRHRLPVMFGAYFIVLHHVTLYFTALIYW